MCSAWTEIKPEIKHRVFTQEAGAGGVRAGWLELEQSNSASFENEFLKTLTSAFCHRCHRFLRKRSGSSWRQQLAATARAAAVGGNSQGNSRSLRHLCWCFPQGSGIAGDGQKFPGRREWQGAAGSSLALGAARDMPRRACLPRKRGKQGAAGRVAEASRGGAIHHRGSSNI